MIKSDSSGDLRSQNIYLQSLNKTELESITSNRDKKDSSNNRIKQVNENKNNFNYRTKCKFFHKSSIKIETADRSARLSNKMSDTLTNLYAKPRIHFTGTGVIKKSLPGYESSSKFNLKQHKINKSSVVKNVQYINRNDSKPFVSVKNKKLPCKSNISAGNKESLNKIDKNIFESNQSDDESKPMPSKKMFLLVSKSLVKCTLCFKQIKLTSMKQHYRTHTGIKPFNCQFCHSCFTRKSDAQRHIISHHSLKPKNLVCSVCEKAFSDESSLIHHLKNHNKALYLFCNICGHKFKQKSYYESHLRFVHSLSVEQETLESGFYSQALKQLKELSNGDVKGFVKSNGVGLNQELKTVMVSSENVEKCSLSIKEEPLCYDSDDEENSDSPINTVEISGNIADSKSSTFIKNGTFSFTQKVVKTEPLDEEEELVAEAIAAAISQAKITLENMQSSVNLSGSETLPINDYCKTEDSTNLIDFSIDRLRNEPKSSEIHISASIDGRMQKFIIGVPAGKLIDATTQGGMDTLVNLVNCLYSDKGQINGNIDVTMHHNIA